MEISFLTILEPEVLRPGLLPFSLQSSVSLQVFLRLLLLYFHNSCSSKHYFNAGLYKREGGGHEKTHLRDVSVSKKIFSRSKTTPLKTLLWFCLWFWSLNMESEGQSAFNMEVT